MKRIISLVMAIVLLFSCTPFSFANSSEENDSVNAEKQMVFFCPVTSDGRGAYPPTTSATLLPGMSYSGFGEFYVSVYTNYKFSDHGGSIRIYVSNSNDIPDDYGVYMMVTLSHPGFLGSQVVDETRYVGVNSAVPLTFTGLDQNTQYYFQFSQGFQTYPTTTVFTITRGN